MEWDVSDDSTERTAYPRFKRLISARELHLFFSPTSQEVAWAAEGTDSYEHRLALLVVLKSYQRMGCFPRREEVPDVVVDFVRRVVDLPEGTLPVYASERTAQQHRTQVRRRTGVVYDDVRARALAEETIRDEAASYCVNPAHNAQTALRERIRLRKLAAGISAAEPVPDDFNRPVTMGVARLAELPRPPGARTRRAGGRAGTGHSAQGARGRGHGTHPDQHRARATRRRRHAGDRPVAC
ncbi:DUF4158 domain-containing protein [Streptosporangium sp. CA-135522]|uniref:DUF4158 domain-containing protein n=1 Tax=Streptosporangium sp. CA-135522 TaxID=3240072 RepID=UPI003D8CE542